MSWPTPGPRHAEYVRKIAKCGHWEFVKTTGGDKAVLAHRASGQTIAYGLHDGGNDYNSARNFATEAQRICGCRFIESRGRKRSRKKIETSGYQPRKTQSELDRSIEIDALLAEFADVDSRLYSYRVMPNRGRSDAAEAAPLAARLIEIEQRLAALHHPAPQRSCA